MSPNNEIQQETTRTSNDGHQVLYIIRHGDRWDYANPSWRETSSRVGDPPISSLGRRQAFETGSFLNKLRGDGDVTVLCSPFLRCIETADVIVSGMEREGEILSLKVEDSVWEIDGHGGVMHKCLPDVQERKCYFPRIDENHSSLFIPSLPESKSKFLERCQKTISQFNNRYPFQTNSAIIIVTHAAGCIGLVQAATGLKLDEINAAGPCAIFRLSRASDTQPWSIDTCDKQGGWNGYMGHISDVGIHTTPWNHFGPNGGYTGPPHYSI